MLDPAAYYHSEEEFQGLFAHGQKHGIMRLCNSNKYASHPHPGKLQECTYKRDKLHGLMRETFDECVDFGLYKNGTRIAYVRYDEQLKKTLRGGSESHMLEDLPDIKPNLLARESLEYRCSHQGYFERMT